MIVRQGLMLGEMEEAVLLCILSLREGAYARRIVEEIRVRFHLVKSSSTIHMILARMVAKGYLKFFIGKSTGKRGGRSRKIYVLTSFGQDHLGAAMSNKLKIWEEVRDS